MRRRTIAKSLRALPKALFNSRPGKIVHMPGRATFILAIVAATLAAQPVSRVRTPAILPITAIHITGNKSLPTDAILTATGLKLGETGGSAIFDAARDRLLGTGYFDAVSYSFKQQDLGFAVTFTVTEMKQVYPVRAEALPITAAELIQILKSGDSLFNGLLPATKQVTDHASATVEQYLSSTNPGLRVRARVAAVGPERFEIQFIPAEGLPVIADVTFEGSKLVSADELHVAMVESGIGQFYSDAGFRALLDRIVRPFFERQGYMGVSFPTITAKPSQRVKGVDVHVVIVDGPQYRLGNVSVGSQTNIDAARILHIANISRTDAINFDDFNAAVARIHDRLHNEGYLDATVSTDRLIHADIRTVDVWFNVDSGALYTFGHLDVIGLGLDGEAAIRKMWAVKTGEPFPDGYQDHFVGGVKAEQLFDNLGEITVMPNINRQTHVVNVALHFTAAPASERHGSIGR